ncbi:MAG: hypothetical protein JNL96_11715 [Planctomycetaceae bacterium]|nr:hypothetical protein [Planctomycetaceae bacterium]
MSSKSLWIGALLAAAIVGSAASAEAGVFRRRCAPQCAPPSCGAPACVAPVAVACGHYEDVVVQRTVYVNVPSVEKRTIRVTECRPEVRDRTYTVCRRVPYKETVTETYTVMVQQKQMRKVTETVYKPVMRTVEQPYTVMVPHVERRQGVKHVVQCSPVQMTRTVCVDAGCWETRQVQIPCPTYIPRCGSCCQGYNPCGACPPAYVTRCVRVWVPKIEHRQVNYTVMKQNVVAQPYEYDVTVCKPETRVRQVQVCEQVAQQVTKEVPVVVCVPEQKTRSFEVTRYKDVQETKTDKYTVMVPHVVEKTIDVQVCKTVPKTIECTVRKWVADAPAAPCAPGCAAPVEAPAMAAPVPAPARPAMPAHPLPPPPAPKPAAPAPAK